MGMGVALENPRSTLALLSREVWCTVLSKVSLNRRTDIFNSQVNTTMEVYPVGYSLLTGHSNLLRT